MKKSQEYSSFLEADLEKGKGDIMQAVGDMERLEQELAAVCRESHVHSGRVLRIQSSGGHYLT